ncbi:MAG: hypothetical protein OSA40_12945 [Phycisphaerales bacterium]|nr:hypothetical protein [Phycisphaerales bacterium]
MTEERNQLASLLRRAETVLRSPVEWGMLEDEESSRTRPSIVENEPVANESSRTSILDRFNVRPGFLVCITLFLALSLGASMFLLHGILGAFLAVVAAPILVGVLLISGRWINRVIDWEVKINERELRGLSEWNDDDSRDEHFRD